MARQQKLSFAKDFAREVIPVPVADEMSESFLAYSLLASSFLGFASSF